jgi:hypothetical protein
MEDLKPYVYFKDFNMTELANDTPLEMFPQIYNTKARNVNISIFNTIHRTTFIGSMEICLDFWYCINTVVSMLTLIASS